MQTRSLQALIVAIAHLHARDFTLGPAVQLNLSSPLRRSQIPMRGCDFRKGRAANRM